MSEKRENSEKNPQNKSNNFYPVQDGREQRRSPDGGGVPEGLPPGRRAIQDAGPQRHHVDRQDHAPF